MLLRGGTLIAALAAVLTLSACGGGGSKTTGVELPPGCTQAAKPTPKDVKLDPPKGGLPPKPLDATVETSCGTFVIALDTKRAPKTTASFASLVRKGMYDDTFFHRIQPGFVIQGGDPLGTGLGGPGYSVDEKPPQNLSYTKGVAAMARSGVEPPGRSGSQFFVVTAADAGLDASYALLGHVTTGLDVVDRIGQLGTPAGVPTAVVVIKKITLSKAKA